MIKYFDYSYKNNIQIYYCNTDSILIKEIDIELMKQFISDNYGDLKVEGRYQNSVIKTKVNTDYSKMKKIKKEIYKSKSWKNCW
jgi:hypothetical protein